MLLFLAAPQWSKAQYFEYQRVIGDTSLPQGAYLLRELPGGNLLILGGGLLNGKTGSILFYKCGPKGDTLWLSAIKSQPRRFGIPAKMELFTNESNYTFSLSTLDSGRIKFHRYTCDTNGRNGYNIYKEFKYAGFDSGFQLKLKYVPEKGFYAYGYTYSKSFVLWHFDTTGTLKWRQDFADSAETNLAWLNFQGDRILFTRQTYNNNMRGIHLLWLDSTGRILKDKAYSYVPTTEQEVYRDGPLLLPDSGFVMGFFNSSNDWKDFPWPVLIRFNKDLDTVWTRELSNPRDPARIQRYDRDEIRRMMLTSDHKIAVLRLPSYNDFWPYYGQAGFQLRKLDLQGNTLSEVSMDSIFKHGAYAPFTYNDMIATSDKGFALVSGTVILAQGRYSGWVKLTKLSDTAIITGLYAEGEKQQGEILLYPNPGRDAISLQLREGFQNADIRIYNALGREVQSHTGVSGNVFTIYREVAPKGIYFLKIKDKQNQTRTLKFIWE